MLWAVDQPKNLSPLATTVLQDPANELLLSAATMLETAVKYGLKKLTLSLPYKQWLDAAIKDLSLTILPVTTTNADRLASLPFHHRDPFDRFMISQALVERVGIVSKDPAFDAYGLSRIW